jgi:hypothetical protein
MNTAPDNARPAPETFVTNGPEQDFVLKLKDIVAHLHQKLNEGQLEPSTVVGLGVCAVQLDGLSTCLFTDSSEKPVSPGIRMASAILATCLKNEDNARVALLLNKAQKLTEQALKIRTGEIINSTLH